MAQHRFDPLSFFFGLLFVVAGLLLLAGGTDALPMDWAGPLVSVLLGVVVLIAARARRPGADAPDPPAADEQR